MSEMFPYDEAISEKPFIDEVKSRVGYKNLECHKAFRERWRTAKSDWENDLWIRDRSSRNNKIIVEPKKSD